MVHELALECPEEAFDTGVVPAIAFMAYAGGDAVLAEQTLVTRGGILTAAIRVVQEPCRWFPFRQRHGEGTLGERATHGPDGIATVVRLDRGIFHWDSLAKNAAARL